LVVPYTSNVIRCDGQPDESIWNSAARTGSFRDTKTGHLVRPYSDTRLLASNDTLYLLLYAADENIHEPPKPMVDQALADFDHFDIHLHRVAAPAVIYHLQIAPDGSLFDARSENGGAEDARWASHIQMGFDADGTANNASDEDEEWLVEAALPLRDIGAAPGETLLISVERCDTPKDGVHSCGAWGLDVASGAAAGAVILPAKR
jgi:hypothetical protein